MSLQTSYYRNVILSIHRGWKNGLYSNAKPLFLLTIIKGIEEYMKKNNVNDINELIGCVK